MRWLTIIAVFCLSAIGASASPSLSADQSSRLLAALDAQGCAGGHVNVGESGFEIVGARCGGGRAYDLVFDHEYRLLRKNARD